MWDNRDLQIQDYDTLKAISKLKKAQTKERNRLKVEELKRKKLDLAVAEESVDLGASGFQSTLDKNDEEDRVLARETGLPKLPTANPETGTLKKREEEDSSVEKVETSSNDNLPPTRTTKQTAVEDSLNGVRRVRIGTPAQLGQGQVPLTDGDLELELEFEEEDEEEDPLKPDPHRPLTHAEYVAGRIKAEKIQPGYVTINSKKYILR
jgi:mannosyl-oligosaccharide alpha-1,2-mannosidase